MARGSPEPDLSRSIAPTFHLHLLGLSREVPGVAASSGEATPSLEGHLQPLGLGGKIGREVMPLCKADVEGR